MNNFSGAGLRSGRRVFGIRPVGAEEETGALATGRLEAFLDRGQRSAADTKIVQDTVDVTLQTNKNKD